MAAAARAQQAERDAAHRRSDGVCPRTLSVYLACWARSARNSRPSDGRTAATSGSTFAGGRPTRRCCNFAKELVALQPDLILSHTTPTTATLLQQTRSIPIIFVFVSDPIGSGFVASFSRPGGNVTGFIVMEPGVVGKWLELLKEIAPGVSRVAFLFNPATAPYAEYYLQPFKAAAMSLAVEAIAAPVGDTQNSNRSLADRHASRMAA